MNNTTEITEEATEVTVEQIEIGPAATPIFAPSTTQTPDTQPPKKKRGNPVSSKAEAQKNQAVRKHREIQAIQLRRSGATYDQIGEHLGVSAMAAYQYVSRYIQRVQKQFVHVAEEVVTIELERCDTLLVRLNAELSVLPEGDTAGLSRITNAIVKVLDRRARYLGLNKDTPLVQMKIEQGTKHTTINNNGTTIGQIQAIQVILPIVKGATTEELIELRDKLQGIKSRGDSQIITQAGSIAIEDRLQPETQRCDGGRPVDIVEAD